MSLLQKLKNLFAPNLFSNSNIRRKNIAFIHEDDAGQIELLPVENFSHLINECEKIPQFSEEHFDGYGWSEVYVRKSPPTEILSRKITLNEFSTPLIENGFTVSPLRFLGMPKLDIEELQFTKGDIKVYCGYSGNLITSIYFEGYYKEKDRSLFTVVLLELSKKYDLILIDWNLKEIFDSRNETEIERFYNRYE